MPKYQIDVPGQGTFEVDSPTDLSDDQAYRAVMGQINATPAVTPDTGFTGALKAGKESLMADVERFKGKTGIKDVQEAEAAAQQREAKAKQVFKPTEEGWTEAPWQKFKETLGGSLPYMAAPVGAGIAAAALPLTGTAATIAGLGATGLTSAAQFTGSNLSRKVQAGQSLEEASLLEAGAAAIPQAALDVIGLRMIPGIRGILGKAGVEITEEQAAKLAQRSLLEKAGSVALTTGKTMGTEGLTETGQQVLERLQAGLSITDEQARKEYYDSFIGGAVLGGTLGTAGQAFESKKVVPGAPPPAPPQAEPSGQLGLGLEGGIETAGPRTSSANDEVQRSIFALQQKQNLTPEEQQQLSTLQAQANTSQTQTTELRTQYDTLEREMDRLKEAHAATDDLQQKKAILEQAQKLDFARQELAGQLEAAAPRATAPEAQGALDFEQPYPKSPLQAAPTIIGQAPATPAVPANLDLEFAKQRLAAGAPLTPAQELMVRQDQQAQRVTQQGAPAPELIIPQQVGGAGTPMSYVVDDAAIDTFGVTKGATKFKQAIRGLDLMNPEDAAKFDKLVEQHERKNAKIDMDAVEAFRSEKPEAVAAREVPERAGIPAEPFNARKGYQQAREAQFAFGQIAAPLSPRDVRAQKKAEYDERTGAGIVDGPTDGGVQLPSTGVQAAEGTTPSETTGMGSAVGPAARPDGRTRTSGKAGNAALAQLAQQVAPAQAPDIAQEEVARVSTQPALEDVLAQEEVSADTEELMRQLGIEPAPRKPTTYRIASTETNGLTKERVESIVKAVTNKWKNAPEIRTVQSEMQLPQSIQDQIKRDGVRRPEGVWSDQDNCVFLIAGNIANAQNAVLTIAHETVGHFGIRGILGDTYLSTMNRIYEGNPEVKALADNKIDRGMDPATAVEEVLAEFAENTPNPTVMQRIINVIRQAFAKVGFPMQSVSNGEIKQLLKDARQFVIEGKGGAKNPGIKIGQVYSADGPLFYSRLGAMVQHAPKDLRNGASGKQWAAWINSNAGKFGVKKEELEWTGVNDLLGLMGDNNKFTTKDVADMLKEEGVKVSEEAYGGRADNPRIREIERQREDLRNEMHAVVKPLKRLSMQLYSKQLVDPSVKFEGSNFYDYPAVEQVDPDNAVYHLINSGQLTRGMVKAEGAALFDSLKNIVDTAEQKDIENSTLYKELQQISPKQTRFEAYTMQGGKHYGELVLTLPKIPARFEHGHWPGVDNPIAHVRFNERKDKDGKNVLFIEEMQSDWGQKGAKEGFQTGETAIPWESEVYVNARSKAMELRNIYNSNNANRAEQERILPELRKAEAAERAISEYNRAVETKTPKAPFVQDTKSWTALAVKRVLRYAADHNIDRVAFISGNEAYNRFSQSHEGESTEKGMTTYYDQILPSVVKDVLRKLGVNSEPTTSKFKVRDSGYYVYVRGEQREGPFRTYNEAVDAGAELYGAGEGTEDEIQIDEAAPLQPKTFIAFNLAPETAAKVKEGQALFREERLPRLTKLEAAPNVGQKIKDSVKAVYDADKGDAWTKFRVAVVDPASGLAKRLSALPLFSNGQLRADMLHHQYAQVNNIVNNGIQSGVPILNADGSVIIETTNDNLARSNTLATALDSNPNVKSWGGSGMEYVAEIARILRGKEIMDEDVARRQIATDAMQAAEKKFKDAKKKGTTGAQAIKLNNEARALQSKYKDEVNLNREKQVTPEHLAWAQAQLKAVPQVQEVLDIWKKVNESLIKLREDAGLISTELADNLRKNNSYVPLFAAEEDLEAMRDPNIAISGTGAKAVSQMHKLKGSELTRNIWENLYKQYAITTAAVFQNQVRKVGIEQLASLDAAEITQNANDPKVNVRYRDANNELADSNGVVHAIVDNPNELAAFQMMHYELTPIMKAMAQTTKVLRAGALINPMYWVKQLIRDPLHASVVGGYVVTPADSIREYVNILKGNSDEAKVLARHGAFGAVDSTVDLQTFLKGIGTEKTTATNMDKALHKIMRMHEASDAATRVAIYKKAYADALGKGMDRGAAESFAVMKARESANFSVHGNSQTLNSIRQLIPFFSAAITSLDTVYRAATGYGLNPKEKAQAKRMFYSRAAMMTIMAIAYAMMLQGDEDYQKLPDDVKDGNWLMPNPLGDGHSFIRIPVPFEVGFLFKTVPEAAVRYLAGNSTGKEVLASYGAGIIQNTPGNGLIIPQAAKPILETMTNHSFFTGRSIESMSDQNLPVSKRGQNASEVAKLLSNLGLDKVNLSPAKIDNIIQGYTAQLGTFAVNAADAALIATEGKSPMARNIEQLPGFKTFMTNPNTSKAVGDFYKLQHEAVETVNEFNKLKKSGDREGMLTFLEDERNKKLIMSEPALRKIQTQLTNISNMVKLIKNNEKLDPEVRLQRVNALMVTYDKVAQQMNSVLQATKLNR